MFFYKKYKKDHYNTIKFNHLKIILSENNFH